MQFRELTSTVILARLHTQRWKQEIQCQRKPSCIANTPTCNIISLKQVLLKSNKLVHLIEALTFVYILELKFELSYFVRYTWKLRCYIPFIYVKNDEQSCSPKDSLNSNSKWSEFTCHKFYNPTKIQQLVSCYTGSWKYNEISKVKVCNGLDWIDKLSIIRPVWFYIKLQWTINFERNFNLTLVK